MKLCDRCQLAFSTWTLYHDHQVTNGCVKVIRPERTTDRTKKQIVDDAEATWLSPYLVGGPAPVTAAKNAYGEILAKLGGDLKAEYKGGRHDGKADSPRSADRDFVQACAEADQAGMQG